MPPDRNPIAGYQTSARRAAHKVRIPPKFLPGLLESGAGMVANHQDSKSLGKGLKGWPEPTPPGEASHKRKSPSYRFLGRRPPVLGLVARQFLGPGHPLPRKACQLLTEGGVAVT